MYTQLIKWGVLSSREGYALHPIIIKFINLTMKYIYEHVYVMGNWYNEVQINPC